MFRGIHQMDLDLAGRQAMLDQLLAELRATEARREKLRGLMGKEQG